MIFDCPICQSNLSDPVAIPCGHTFCYQCIYNSISQAPRCPLCRIHITVKQDQLRVNLLLSSILRKEESKPIIQSQEQRDIIIYTKYTIYPFSLQKIKIEKYTESNLTTPDYQTLLNDINVFIQNINTKHTIKSKIKRIQFKNNNIIVTVLNSDFIHLQDHQVIGINIESLDQFGVKQKKDVYVPIGTGKEIQFDRNLSEEEIIRLINLKIKISQFLDKVFNQHQCLDAVEQEVYQKLMSSKLFDYLQNSDLESLRKLSYCLAGQLKISVTQKMQIIRMPIVDRLETAEKYITFVKTIQIQSWWNDI
ncbi:LON peptidase N-terminal domain and RING finger protein 3 [Paramecium bursaria]